MEDRSALAMLAVRHTVSFTDDELNKSKNENTNQINNTKNSSCNSLKKESDDSSSLSQDEDNFDKKNSDNCLSYIESYTKAIQAVEWMLKLDRLRQESAMYSTLSK